MIVQITLPRVFGLLAPIGLIEHHTASIIWLLLNVVSVILSIAQLLKLTNLRWYLYHGAILVA